MNRNLLFLSALAGAISMAGSASAQNSWNFANGHVSIQFDRAALSRSGISVSDLRRSDALAALRLPGNSWSIDSRMSTLTLDADGRSNVNIGVGELVVNGGFTLSSNGDSVNFQDFGLQLKKESGPADLNVVGYHYPPYEAVPLEAGAPVARYDQGLGHLDLIGYELRVSHALANIWGRPQLAGTRIGTLTVTGDLKLAPRPTVSATPRGGPELDIAMCQLYGFTAVPGGSETINGIVYNSYAASTDSVNFGAHPVTWLSTSQAANVNHMHPTIGLNVFRKLSTGELEQIGEGDLKHAFTALQNPTCSTGCQSLSGTALGVGCSDPYWNSLNYSQPSLGPKIEVNPYTGIWNKAGSSFPRAGNYPYTPTEFRMKVANQDILPAGQATYWMEGYYMAGFANNGNYVTSNPAQITETVDTNKYNNFGWRQVNITVSSTGVASGTTLGSFSTDNNESTNPNRRPYITQWGDARWTMEPNKVGEVITAVRVTNVGSGWYKYDYAVYNMDLDRQVKSFHVSVSDSLSVRNISFRDIDKNAANEWTMTRANGDISWEMQAGVPNPLIYARMYNFRFEAQSAAVPGWASATMVKAGDFPELNRAVSGPPPSTQPVTGTVTIPGWVGNIQAQVNLRLTPIDSGSLTNINGVTVAHPSGAISAQTAVRGRYLVSVGGAPFLRKNFAPIVTVGHDGNDIPVNVTLISGDVDGSGEIDAADIDMVISQFGSTSSTPCDADGSAEVDAADIDLLIANFGQTGDI
ncbi:MAG: hypothetical protein JNK63_09865 [Chthonomonas sp.]|nr:hypothetical protein [Chthonomonas sp.]